MSETIKSIVYIMVKISFFLLVAVSVMILFTFGISLISVTLNQSVLGDLMGIIQIWCPFNLGTLYTWCITGSALLVAYHTTYYTAAIVNNILR